MTSSRWIATQKETTFGTAEFDNTDDPAQHIKPGICDGDIVAPWNKQEHKPVHDITSVKPVSFSKKAITCDFDAEYDYNHGGVFRRFFGAATHADNVSTFKFPAAFSATVDSWSWQFRHGAKAFDAVGGVTNKVGLFIQQFAPVKVIESVMAQRVTDGEVFTLDPIFPSGLTNELPYYFNQIATKTAGADSMGTLQLAHFEFLQTYARDYGSVNDYCNRIVRGYQGACLFDFTAVYDGSTDELRDKLVADDNEALIINVQKSATHYLYVKLYSSQYTGIEMKSLANGSTLYTVSGYAVPSGADYVEVKVREGIDWSS